MESTFLLRGLGIDSLSEMTRSRDSVKVLEIVVKVVAVAGTIGRMGAPIMGVKQLQSLVTDVMRALSFFPI